MEGSGVSVSYLGEAPRVADKPLDSPAKPAAPEDDGPSFRSILSALNPLQYLPVVGTIYRAITGDTIPEGLRIAGSFVASALTGGPLGMLLNAAVTAAEKLTGIDPEEIAHDVAASLGLAPAGSAAAPAGTPAAAPVAAPAGTPAATPVAAPGAAPAGAPPRLEAGAPLSSTSLSAAVAAATGPTPARLQEGLSRYARLAIA